MPTGFSTTPSHDHLARLPARRHPTPKGWLLVGLIILISAVILALAGVTFFLAEHRRNTSLRQNQTKAIYLAQAGVMQELYDFRSDNGVSLSEVTVTAGTAGDDVYDIAGPAADFLLVNMRGNVGFSTSNLCPAGGRNAVPRDRITGWSVRNVLASGDGALELRAIRVRWSPDSSARIIRLDFNGTSADWLASGCGQGCNAASCQGVANDTLIDLTGIPVPDRTINANTRWAANAVWFSTDTMEGMTTIDLTFTVRVSGTPVDSTRTAHWHSADPADRTAEFTIRSQGTVRIGAFPFSLWRRLQADYRLCHVSGTACDSDKKEREGEGAIISYQELTALTP